MQFVIGTEAAAAELPCVLDRKEPQTKSRNLGSGDNSATPKVIVFGGAYDEEAINQILGATSHTKMSILRANQVSFATNLVLFSVMHKL